MKSSGNISSFTLISVDGRSCGGLMQLSRDCTVSIPLIGKRTGCKHMIFQISHLITHK